MLEREVNIRGSMLGLSRSHCTACTCTCLCINYPFSFGGINVGIEPILENVKRRVSVLKLKLGSIEFDFNSYNLIYQFILVYL